MSGIMTPAAARVFNQSRRLIAGVCTREVNTNKGAESRLSLFERRQNVCNNFHLRCRAVLAAVVEGNVHHTGPANAGSRPPLAQPDVEAQQVIFALNGGRMSPLPL
jgi:hypothetical protein